jgi:hypothetical protein
LTEEEIAKNIQDGEYLYGTMLTMVVDGHGDGSSTMKRVIICVLVLAHQEHKEDYYNSMIRRRYCC